MFIFVYQLFDVQEKHAYLETAMNKLNFTAKLIENPKSFNVKQLKQRLRARLRERASTYDTDADFTDLYTAYGVLYAKLPGDNKLTPSQIIQDVMRDLNQLKIQ